MYINSYILFIHVLTLFYFCSVITVSTMILIIQMKMKKKMRMIAAKERMTLMKGNQLGHSIGTVLKIMKMCLMFMLS